MVRAEGTGFDGFTTVQKLKLWLTDGSETVLDLAATLTLDGQTGKTDDEAIEAVAPGYVITYKTNSSGKIDNVTVEVPWEPAGSLDIDDDLSLVKFGGTSYKVTADTLILNLKTKNARADFDKAAVLTVEEFLDLPASGEVGAVVFTGTFADLIVVVDASTPVSDTMYGMVYGSYQAMIGPSVQTVLRILVKGTITDYPAGTTTMAAKKVIGFKEADGAATNVTDMSNELVNGTIEYTSATEDTVYKWRVAAIDLVNNVLTLKQINDEGTVKTGSTTRYLWLTADTLYFDAVPTNPTSLAAEDISKDAVVDVYVDTTDNTVVAVVVKGY